MKRVILGLSILSLSLMSCNRDSDDNVNVGGGTTINPIEKQPVLLTSRVVTKPDGAVETYTTTYEGQKIVQEVNQATQEKVLFLYTGDNITKLITKDATLEFSYDSEGRLVKKLITLSSGVQSSEVYTHEDNKTIKSVQTTDSGEKLNHTYKLFDNGDVSSILTTNEDNSSITNTTFLNDKFNSPRKNIKGLQKLMLPFSPQTNVKQKMVSVLTRDKNGDTHQETSVIKYDYNLNKDNYPTEVFITETSGGQVKETKEVYQYNQ